jgi:galactonate dehydratase
VKIERIETLVAEKWMFVEVVTDTGLRGHGEGGLWVMPRVAEAAVQAVSAAIIGKDPLAPADIIQSIYRFSHFRGSAIGAALSAIDIALWDIAGKHYGVPVHRLLGGPTRDRVRLYVHLKGRTPEELAADAASAVRQGFTAVRLDPLIANWPVTTVQDTVNTAVAGIRAVREAIDSSVDICVECHFKLTPAIAMAIAEKVRGLGVMFLEDPLPPENTRQTGELASRLPAAIAAGERLVTLEEFDDLLSAGPVAYIRPDLSLCGGFTHGRKVAALAEAKRVGVVPHNFLSPFSTAICAHYAAAISNPVLLEYLGDDAEGPRSRVLKTPLTRDGGFLRVPEEPGLGVSLDLEALRAVPPLEFDFSWARHRDGSVVDR